MNFSASSEVEKGKLKTLDGGGGGSQLYASYDVFYFLLICSTTK